MCAVDSNAIYVFGGDRMEWNTLLNFRSVCKNALKEYCFAAKTIIDKYIQHITNFVCFSIFLVQSPVCASIAS